jgi:hypothetical protein
VSLILPCPNPLAITATLKTADFQDPYQALTSHF